MVGMTGESQFADLAFDDDAMETAAHCHIGKSSDDFFAAARQQAGQFAVSLGNQGLQMPVQLAHQRRRGAAAGNGNAYRPTLDGMWQQGGTEPPGSRDVDRNRQRPGSLRDGLIHGGIVRRGDNQLVSIEITCLIRALMENNAAITDQRRSGGCELRRNQGDSGIRCQQAFQLARCNHAAADQQARLFREVKEQRKPGALAG